MNKSTGDRELPLEMNFQENFTDHPLVGLKVEVSPIAGGQLQEKRGESGEVLSVSQRLGEVVGYQVRVGDQVAGASLKDVYVRLEVLEDVQPGTPTSLSIQECLEHWSRQRTYWHTRIDGLESLCFSLATATPRAQVESVPGGWRFLVPDPMPDRHTVVDCRAISHDNFWTLNVSVFPKQGAMLQVPLIQNHWARVFSWSSQVCDVMGWGDWQEAQANLQRRAESSARLLQPMVEVALARAQETALSMGYELDDSPFNAVYAAFSSIRLKPSYIGLCEPPTDRRPYTVLSISPSALKTYHLLRQVVLHECIHIAVASSGGDPHNGKFKALADALGLEKKYQD